MTTSNQANELERAHQKALKLIYRHTHRDYKGSYGGAKSIMVCRDGASCLVPLDCLTEAEIADRLPSAMKKENERLAAAKALRPALSAWERVDEEGGDAAAMCM